MYQLDKLKAQRKEIYKIARKHKVKKLYVFGSCARREETPKSDIDFIAEFGHGTDIVNHVKLEKRMARLLKRHVDVVSEGALRNDSFERSVRQDMVEL